MPTISRETQRRRFILCYGNNMSTLPRLRLLKQHCRWRRSTSWRKRMGVLAKNMRQKRRTILQPDCKCEGNGVGHHAKHKQKATLECHLLNATIFVIDLITAEFIWHFWLNSVLVFIFATEHI